MGEEVRETVLGHVQRGGSASAFDRNLGTLLGNDAVNTLMNIKPDDEPKLIGLRGNRITHSPLEECVKENQNIVKALAEHNYEKVMDLRGSSFREALQTFNTMLRALPHPPQKGQKRYKLAVMHAGAPAPGMNTAVRAAVRIGLDKGHTILGIRNGFPGLANQEIIELNWMSVNGWASMGGAELGTNRKIPSGSDIYNIARTLEEQQIQGVLIIGGWTAYESVFKLFNSRENYPAFNIPFICLPASISNNLPGSELSIGADTALNNIVEAIDKIKDSAVAQSRVFVVEVMGRYCGYLALMSGLATGAERVYMHEEGVTLNDLLKDVEILNARFTSGKRLGLMIRNEYANAIYSTSFICSLFEEEGKDLFDVRQSILGHMQEGGKPSPFDRIQATRLATRCINYLIQQLDSGSSQAAFIGLQGKEIEFHNFEDFDHLVDFKFQRPKEQWWLELRPILTTLTQFN
jgi:6-phosphofructokinase 1